jgi:RNA polymerase sigma factor (TIGR02999 family)
MTHSLQHSGAPSSSPSPDPPASPSGAAVRVTDLLLAWGAGDRAALDTLLPIVYGELRRQAARALRREGEAHSLQATALVHEAYFRLVEQDRVQWQNRAQFFGVAAQILRRILIDHARARRAAKRGGGAVRLTLEELNTPHGGDRGGDALDILALHDALERLGKLDPAQVRLVELRYFAGLTIEETAAALGLSPATVKREWAVARGWLRRELALT